MADFVIELKGLDELKRKLGKRIEPYIQGLTVGIGEELKLVLKNPPGPAHHPVIWASEKQRRWWFAARREAGLPFGYARDSDNWSQKLPASWTVEKRGSMDALLGTKGIAYAGYVQSDAKQSAQHKATGWITDKIAIARVKASGVIGRLWKATVENIFR